MKTFLLITLSLSLIAAEESPLIVDHDVRVTVSALPHSYDASFKNNETGETFSSDGSLDSAGWVAFDYQASLHKTGPFAFLVGGGIDFIHISEEDSAGRDTIDGVGLHLTAGGSIRPTAMLSFEGSVFGGFGGASGELKDKTDGTTLTSDSGGYGIVGILGRAVVTFKPGFQAFLQVGFVSAAFTTNYEPTATTVDFDLDAYVRGGTFGGGLGWRF